ncbi:MAG: DUF362 domain-containing protein [Candidatus Eisenbacteria bacterium]
MNRRRFLRFGIGALAGGVALPWIGGARAEEPVSPEKAARFPEIALARGDAKDATRRALAALGGIGRFVPSGAVVLIKPNASFPSPPEWGATTHPEVVASLIALCLEAGARRVFVADHTMQDPDTCFEVSGTRAAVAPFSEAKLVSLDDRKAYRAIEIPGGKALRKAEIPVLLEKADVFINAPTAKSHAATAVSLGLKNLMGLVWDRNVFHQEIDLHQGIADLGTALRPNLTVLDAQSVLKTGGPAGPGDVEMLGAVVAGIDPVAVDAYGVGLSSWNGQTLLPGHVGYIRHAAAHGLGTFDRKAIRVEEVG